MINQPAGGEDALVQRIQALETQLRELAAARTLEAAAIGQGGITISDGGGITIRDGGALQMGSTEDLAVLYAGTTPIPDGSGRTQQVVLLARDDGSTAMGLGDFGTTPGHPHQQDLFIYDRSLNIILADDSVSGVGVARPHLAEPALQNTNIATWPATSAGSFTEIAACFVERQNAQLSWTIALAAGAGITGQYRLLCNGHQIGDTQTVTNTVAYWSDDAPWPSDVPIFSDVYLSLQARVSAGSGTVAAACYRLRGNQS